MKKGESPIHDFSSFGHLERVFDLLNYEDIPARNFFYAAYEIRCGIEARLKEYLGAQKDIPKKLKNGWRIDALAKGAEAIFKSRDRILRFQITIRRTGKICILLYTPVGSDLQRMGERLGMYLHSAWDKDTNSGQWWDGFRELILASTVGLFRANVGTLLGPPLVRDGRHGREMSIAHRFPDREISEAYLRGFGTEGGMWDTQALGTTVLMNSMSTRSLVQT
jgi:hypothetical protein